MRVLTYKVPAKSLSDHPRDQRQAAVYVELGAKVYFAQGLNPIAAECMKKAGGLEQHVTKLP